MYERTQVIAEFATEAGAQVALTRLRLDGICAEIIGDVPSFLGRLPFAPIQVVVAISQTERARFILSAAGVEVLEPDWETLAELEIDGWLCPLCDTEVDLDEDVCPECSTTRLEQSAREE
jgi:hypothetical protein